LYYLLLLHRWKVFNYFFSKKFHPFALHTIEKQNGTNIKKLLKTFFISDTKYNL